MRTSLRAFLASAVLLPVTIAAQTPPSFTEWAKSRAVPIDLTSETASFAALDRLIEPARLIGVGESVHDQQQFLQFRRRLLVDLVRRHRVTALILESGLPEALALDDYVTGRTDSIDYDAAFKYGFGALDEPRKTVEWLREWNRTTGKDRPVRIYGADLPGSAGTMVPALDRLTAMIGTGSPEVVGLLAWLRPLAERASGAFWRPAKAHYDALTPAARDSLRKGTALLVDLVDRLTRDDRTTERLALRLALVARQTETMLSTGAFHPDNPRDQAMAENTRWALAQQRTGDRAVLWAHNAHVQRIRIDGPPAVNGPTISMGVLLGEQLRSGYLAIGTAYGGPSADSASAPVAESVDQALGGLGRPAALVPLRPGPPDGPARNWLSTRRPIRFQVGHLFVRLGDAFDAIAYFDRVEPAAKAH